MVKLQESPDDMPPGQTPHTVVVYAHGDLVRKYNGTLIFSNGYGLVSRVF